MPRISLTKSLVSYALSAPSVMRSTPSTRSAIIIAATRSAVPLHWSNSVSTTSPFRFSIITLPQYASLASWPPLLRASRASGSVVDWCVSLLRFSPWKSTFGGQDRPVVDSSDPSVESSSDSPKLRSASVYREVLIAGQTFCLRLSNNLAEELTRHMAFQKPVAVLGEDRWVPH